MEAVKLAVSLLSPRSEINFRLVRGYFEIRTRYVVDKTSDEFALNA
jgi:hypothetical protein